MRKPFVSKAAAFFFSACIAFASTAQSYKEKKVYTVNINEAQSSVKAQVSSKSNVLKHPDSEKTYYWYSSNKILSTTGSYEGKLLHGKYTVFYLDNNLMEKGNFKYGLKNGKWFKWYPDGTIRESSEWKKGDMHGTLKNFNSKGELLSSAEYRHNKLNGETVIYEQGKVIRKKYKNGVEVLPVEKKPKTERAKKVKKDSETKPSEPPAAVKETKDDVKKNVEDKSVKTDSDSTQKEQKPKSADKKKDKK